MAMFSTLEHMLHFWYRELTVHIGETLRQSLSRRYSSGHRIPKKIISTAVIKSDYLANSGFITKLLGPTGLDVHFWKRKPALTICNRPIFIFPVIVKRAIHPDTRKWLT